MAIDIKYIGTQDRWPELAVTGKQSVWALGQEEERQADEALLLLATGLFERAAAAASGGLRSAQARIAACSAILSPSKFASTGGSQNNTWSSVSSAWAPFNAVRILFCNPTTAPVTVDNCAVAASANAASSVQPTGAWSAPTGVITVPAGTASNPGYVLSPKIALRSIARDDGSPFPLLFTRCFFAAGNTTYVYGTAGANLTAATWLPRSEGHAFSSANITGDMVSTPGSWTTGATHANPFAIMAGAVFSYDASMAAVVGCGDSIMTGDFGTSAFQTPFGFKATARLAALGRRCTWTNAGWGGQTIQQIAARAKTLVDAVSPAVLMLPSWTPNSLAVTQADWDTQWQTVIDAAEYQYSKGGQVLLLSPYVNNSLTAAQDGFRQLQRRRVAASGFPFADLENVISDGAVPARWKAGLNYDSTHPNDDGHEAMVSSLSAVLSQLIP